MTAAPGRSDPQVAGAVVDHRCADLFHPFFVNGFRQMLARGDRDTYAFQLVPVLVGQQDFVGRGRREADRRARAFYRRRKQWRRRSLEQNSTCACVEWKRKHAA